MTKEEILKELRNQIYDVNYVLKRMKYMIEYHKTKEQESKENKDFPSEMYHHGAWFTLYIFVVDLEDILTNED